MEPLIIIVTYNRPEETRRTLEALEATTDLDQVEVAIVDNGSENDTLEIAQAWAFGKSSVFCYPLPYNIGCPRALNFALEVHRKPGQPVVKLDNDVRLLEEGWVERVRGLVREWMPTAMVAAYYDGMLEGRMLSVEEHKELPLYRIMPVIGHCVWHTGLFMDRVGFFDVLAPDHLYGFEDLVMSRKARQLGFFTLAWEGWRIENIQRRNSLGDRRDAHVEMMRPLYQQRCAALAAGGPIRTDPAGEPIVEVA